VVSALDGSSRVIAGSITLTVVRDRNSRSVTVTPEKPPQTSVGSTGDTRTIVIPRIEIPTIPAISVRVPQIFIPSMPAINVAVPKINTRVIRPRVVII